MNIKEYNTLKRICKGRWRKGQMTSDGQALDEIYEYLKTVKVTGGKR